MKGPHRDCHLAWGSWDSQAVWACQGSLQGVGLVSHHSLYNSTSSSCNNSSSNSHRSRHIHPRQEIQHYSSDECQPSLSNRISSTCLLPSSARCLADGPACWALSERFTAGHLSAAMPAQNVAFQVIQNDAGARVFSQPSCSFTAGHLMEGTEGHSLSKQGSGLAVKHLPCGTNLELENLTSALPSLTSGINCSL